MALPTIIPIQHHLLTLPRELRDLIYTHVLVIVRQHILFFYPSHTRPGEVDLFAPCRPRPNWLALLRTNRQIHDETAPLVYGVHQFNFIDYSFDQTRLVRTFLDGIGKGNAGWLRRVCVSFPAEPPTWRHWERLGEGGGGGKVKGKGGGKEDGETLYGVRLLREMCVRLRTLEVHVQSQVFLDGEDGENGEEPSAEGEAAAITRPIFIEVLPRIAEELQGIPSLKEVLIVPCHANLDDDVVRAMEGFGWSIQPRGRETGD
ncbi:hypothetical protein B0J18DRAFT_139975 [Chaetomium sp. MPI-SDFR-AT-0129]|nr:hypothetical protein B0J18DRAFT_139975 [Chaetomium sp. MPI-SDFR-AT-0129]